MWDGDLRVRVCVHRGETTNIEMQKEKETVADLQALDSSDLTPFCFLFPRPSCLSLFFLRNDKNDGFSIGASATFFSDMVGVVLRE